MWAVPPGHLSLVPASLAPTRGLRRASTWGLLESKTFAKTLKNHYKHKQHPDKTLATYVENICNIQTNTFATHVRKNR
jgi:hypothetical protein